VVIVTPADAPGPNANAGVTPAKGESVTVPAVVGTAFICVFDGAAVEGTAGAVVLPLLQPATMTENTNSPTARGRR